MLLEELKSDWDKIYDEILNHNSYPSEGNFLDYKLNLNFPSEIDLERNTNKNNLYREKVILYNLAKDILSYANRDGGLIILGIREGKDSDREQVKYSPEGVNAQTHEVLKNLDCSELKKLIKGITKYELGIETGYREGFGRDFHVLMIPKAEETLVAEKDYEVFNKKILSKGDIYFRDGDGNEKANESSSRMNKFVQIKANEKSKDNMSIWSHLLPEMIDINPKETLILNLSEKKVYGFNKRGNKLDSGKIEIEDKSNTFKVILQSIQAGEIGKISSKEGKPLYRIVGDITSIEPKGDPITTVTNTVCNHSGYKRMFEKSGML